MDHEELMDVLQAQQALNKALSSQIIALRALTRSMSLQSCFDRTLLHTTAKSLVVTVIAELTPDLQDSNTLDKAQRELDDLLPPICT
jgi:hypothetical protein